MADGGTCRRTGQRGTAGVAEQVQHLYRAACGTDFFCVPCPVDSLLREHAGVLEAGGADDESELILALAAADLPLFGQTALVLPLAAALIGAVINSICLCPQGALLGRFPHHLRVRADEDGLTPALQTVAVGGIQQFIVFPGICRAHSVLPSLLSVSYWPRMRLLILSTMRSAQRWMASRSWPSTITRIFGSVPDTRTSTRPMPISFCCSFSMKPASTSSSL